MNNIYITIVRTGKDEVTATVAKGSTPREVFEQEGISSDVYGNWSMTFEDGSTPSLDTPLQTSGALICGARVDGA